MAYADSGDPEHARCLALLDHEPTVLVTTALVVAETGWLISRQLGALAEAEFYRSVVDGELEVEALGREDWVRVSKLTGKYADNDLGGVDPSLVVVAERLLLNTIATLDHSHLRAVRPKHVEAFKIVPWLVLFIGRACDDCVAPGIDISPVPRLPVT